MPVAVDPELIGTRAAVNPFDAFSPFGEAAPAKGRQNNRRRNNNRSGQNSYNDMPGNRVVEETHDARESQADFFGVATLTPAIR